MAKRFPVLYPMPFGEEQYRQYLELASEATELTKYNEKCRETIIPTKKRVCETHQKKGIKAPQSDCPDCMLYHKTMISGTISNLIQCGFLKREKEHSKSNKTHVSLPPHSFDSLKGDFHSNFPFLVINSLLFAWSKEKADQVAVEGFLDIINKLPKHTEDFISQKDILDSLNRDNDPINGYDLNLAGEGSARTMREYLKLMGFIGIVENDGSGKYRKSSDNSLIKKVKNDISKLSILSIAENTIEKLGPSHPALSKDFITALSKYYIYRHCSGIGKQRSLITKLRTEMDKIHKPGENRGKKASGNTIYEYHKRDAKRFGKRIGKAKNIKNQASKYRNLLQREIAKKFGIPIDKDNHVYMELSFLSVTALSRIISSKNLDEVKTSIRRAKGRFDRSELDEIRHQDGLFFFHNNFEFYSNWQKLAVEKWMKDLPDEDHYEFNGIVSAVTGSGKTIMALLAIHDYIKKFPTACISIIVPTKVLMYQWARELSRLLGLSSSEIGLRGDGFKDSFSNKRVIVAIVNSAIRNNNLMNDIDSLPLDIKHLLIADECHRYGGDEYNRVFDCRIDARLGLSATPPAEDVESTKEADDNIDPVIDALGKSFYSLNYREAREKNLICEFKIIYVGVQLNGTERGDYKDLTKKIGKALEKIRLRYGHRLDAMKADSLDQKLQSILKSDEYPDPAIGKYFKHTRERREIVHQAQNRKACYGSIIKKGINDQKKIMVFHEKISQLEDVVSALKRRQNFETNKVDSELEGMLYTKRYKPVMYHSRQDHKWNKWGMEWFRNDIANTMLSVKALVEGVDVPSADLGIVRVSSSSVRQRIQTIGRVLRKGRDKTAEIYVLFALDTVDENIFRSFNWSEELGVSAVEYSIWDDRKEELIPIENPIKSLPQPKAYEDDRPPIEVDVSNLKLGDQYPGRFAGEMYHVSASGKPYKRSKYGRVFIKNNEMIKAGQIIRRMKGGGKILVSPQGNLVTQIKGQGSIFLGITDPNSIRGEVNTKIENFLANKKKRKKPKTFQELFGG